MFLRVIATLVIIFTFASSVSAAENYRVTLLRAAPGNLPALIDTATRYKVAQQGNPIIMRHSQGDHWDLMILEPAGENWMIPTDYSSLVSFQHDFLVKSSWSWKDVKSRSASAGLFHIEMFHAAVGHKADILQQRFMENKYYNATNRPGNIVFETVFGSDVDNFTIGFYKDIKAFATDPDLPDEVFEKAATDAGFSSRSDIGFHLRRFINRHYDTLASQVK
jgi:hypothetical protein